MDIIYSKCYNGVIMVGGFADVDRISSLEDVLESSMPTNTT